MSHKKDVRLIWVKPRAMTLIKLLSCTGVSFRLVQTWVFSSPEPLGSQGQLIVYPSSRRPSVVRPSVVVVNNFKHLLRNRWADQSQILCGASLGGGTIFCSRHLGHMTKMAATPIYGKNPSKIFFSRAGRPIFTKLGM